jgi:hypothetical protein
MARMATTDSSFYLFYAIKSHSLDGLLNYGTITIQNNGTPSLPSNLIFNIARLLSRVRFLHPQPSISDKIFYLLGYS